MVLSVGLINTQAAVTFLRRRQIDAFRVLWSGCRFRIDIVENGYEYARRHFESVSKIMDPPIAVPESVNNLFR